jgi:hypothetical protein
MPQRVNLILHIAQQPTFQPMVEMVGWMEAAMARTGMLKLTMPV